jgi:hypothetical protein
MAKYLILIYGQESGAASTPDQWDWMMQAHGRFAQAVDQQGGRCSAGSRSWSTATWTRPAGVAGYRPLVGAVGRGWSHELPRRWTRAVRPRS